MRGARLEFITLSCLCENSDARPLSRILLQISIFSGIRPGYVYRSIPLLPATNYIFPQITSEVAFNGHTQRGKIYERCRAERSAPFEKRRS